MIRDVAISFSNILRSLELVEDRHRHLVYLDNIELRGEIVDIYASLEDLLNLAADNNKGILNEEVYHEPPRPISEILKEEVEKKLISLK